MFQDNNVGPGFHLQPHGYMNDNNPNMSGMNGNNGNGMFGQNQRRQYGNNNDQPRKSKVFTPVTLKMVQQSQPRPDDQCEYDGDTINDIIIVGRLLKRIEEPMRTVFEINDNTCTHGVLFYHKGENQVPIALRNFNYEQFTYAKIYGNIRVFKEEKAIVGTHIKRIEKFDEVTNHFLSVFISNCIRKKGILKPRDLIVDQPQNLNNNENQMQVDSMGGQQLQQQPQQQQQYGNFQGGYNRGGNGNNYYNNNYKNNYNKGGNGYYNKNGNNYNNQYQNNYNNNQGNQQQQQQQQQQFNNQEQQQFNQNNNNGNMNDNQQQLSDNDIQNKLLCSIKDILQNQQFAQKDQLKQMMVGNYPGMCREDRFEKALNKLMNDGQITQAHDNNTFLIV